VIRVAWFLLRSLRSLFTLWGGIDTSTVALTERLLGAFREVLAEQPVGVLVGAALPATLRVAEVDRQPGIDAEFGWLSFFRCFFTRGPTGVQLVISDDHPGLVVLLGEVVDAADGWPVYGCVISGRDARDREDPGRGAEAAPPPGEGRDL